MITTLDKYREQIEATETITLSDDDQRRRLSCYIYFLCMTCGRGKYRRRGTVMEIVEPSPVSGLRCLGYPSRGKIWRAIAWVKRTAPLETRAYEVATRIHKEALRRLEMTANIESWSKLFFENRGWMTGRALSRPYAIKYDPAELGSRKEEEARAKQDLKEIWAEMERLKNCIFDKMQVPERLRFL